MQVNIKNAVSLFFPNPSLELVYFEAIANSIDAGASEIHIKIEMDAFTDVSTLKISIEDNGRGFNDRNFEKFSNLLEIEEEQHKGIGRLVFLNYFDKVNVQSEFENKRRTFEFSTSFKGINNLEELSGESENRTVLSFSAYRKEKVKAYSYLIPEDLKKTILQKFFPTLYQKKLIGEKLCISINLIPETVNIEQGFVKSSAILDSTKIPDLIEESFTDDAIDLYAKFKLLYSIRPNPEFHSVLTSICADGRTIPVSIISEDAIPHGYEIVFLLYSDFFTGKTNPSREELSLDELSLKAIKRFFRDKVSEKINALLPEVKTRNTELQAKLAVQYPHLHGYFEKETIGLIDKGKSLEIAQRKFFSAQKEILEATELTDAQFEKSLELSSRALTEYILYRNRIIQKMKSMNADNTEADIHNLIVPKKSILTQGTFSDDLYTNNAWLLDDKFMMYSTILSDRKLSEIYKELEIFEDAEESGRPDITVVFSADPVSSEKVDVVIVELKRLGLDLAGKEEVVSQLRQRARRLVEYYPDKIQRIWFYGIIDFNDEFRISLLEDRYIEIFSSGSMYYKEQPIILDSKTRKEVPVGLYVLSFDALISDAEARNSTFLKILTDGFSHGAVR